MYGTYHISEVIYAQPYTREREKMSYRLTTSENPLKTLAFLGKTPVLPMSYQSYQEREHKMEPYKTSDKMFDCLIDREEKVNLRKAEELLVGCKVIGVEFGAESIDREETVEGIFLYLERPDGSKFMLDCGAPYVGRKRKVIHVSRLSGRLQIRIPGGGERARNYVTISASCTKKRAAPLRQASAF